MPKRRCPGLHTLLQVREYNAHGATVDCLLCDDTFQIRESTLAERYLHAPHVSPEGVAGDKDFFILGSAVE